jgi:hypothetical protein
MVVLGLGLVLTVAPLTTVAMSSAPAEHAGVASAVNNDVARIGSLVAVALLPVVSGITGASYLHPLLFSAGFATAVLVSGVAAAAGGILAAALIRNPRPAPVRRPREGPGRHLLRPRGSAPGPRVGRHDAGAVRRDNGAMTTRTTTTATFRFRRMDESTAEQWAVIGAQTFEHQDRVASQVLDMLQGLRAITDGFAVDQLTHSCRRPPGPRSRGPTPRWSWPRSATTSASTSRCPTTPASRPRSCGPTCATRSSQVILAHQDFQGRSTTTTTSAVTPNAREQYRDEPWFALAAQFADEFDQNSFDPDYPTKPLSHFEPLVREVFAKPRSF